MTPRTLAEALEREHREIDRGIEAFLEDPGRVEPLTDAMAALRRHIFLEEEFLFPPLREAGMVAPIVVMLREHGEIWRTMDAVDAGLAGAEPAEAPKLCRALLVQLAQHNSKEEAILYTQADDVLTAPAAADLEAFIESGAIPPGWVCAEAGQVAEAEGGAER